MSWPRAEIYGDHPWGQFAALLATLALGLAAWHICSLSTKTDGDPAPSMLPGKSLTRYRLAAQNLTIENRLDRPARYRVNKKRRIHENQRIGATTDRQTVGDLVKLQLRKRQKPAHPRARKPAVHSSDSWAGASTSTRHSGWLRPG